MAAKKSTRKPAKGRAKKPLKRIAKKPVRKGTKKPARKARPVKKAASSRAAKKKFQRRPARKITIVKARPVASAAKRPARKMPVKRPAKRPARKKPAKRPARKMPVKRPAKRPARKKPAKKAKAPGLRVAKIVDGVISGITQGQEKRLEAVKRLASSAKLPSFEQGLSQEEIALKMLDVYFSEVARYGLKRKLSLDEVINAYFYALLRVQRKAIEVEEVKKAAKRD